MQFVDKRHNLAKLLTCGLKKQRSGGKLALSAEVQTTRTLLPPTAKVAWHGLTFGARS